MPWQYRAHARSPPPPPAACTASNAQLLGRPRLPRARRPSGVVVLGLAKLVFADVGQLLKQPADVRREAAEFLEDGTAKAERPGVLSVLSRDMAHTRPRTPPPVRRRAALLEPVRLLLATRRPALTLTSRRPLPRTDARKWLQAMTPEAGDGPRPAVHAGGAPQEAAAVPRRLSTGGFVGCRRDCEHEVAEAGGVAGPQYPRQRHARPQG